MVEIPRYPFEATVEQLNAHLDHFVTTVFETLESGFETLPKGDGFIEYASFEQAYETLKKATGAFSRLDEDQVLDSVDANPRVFLVLRAMLGYTPPEWAYIAERLTNVEIPQGSARRLDRDARLFPERALCRSRDTRHRLGALVETACKLLSQPAPVVASDQIHRLDKADTRMGLPSLRNAATMGMPYAMVLYERLLGRPFATHRDSVSSLVGDAMEAAIERQLDSASASYRKTKRAESVEGFDQAPDFLVPSEYNPSVVIEAKITEDDGTARDKVTRVQHLAELGQRRVRQGAHGFQVVACIDGRGFGVRRNDMIKLLQATGGKVFTLATLEHLVSRTQIREFASH
jgi:hypothetical protein